MKNIMSRDEYLQNIEEGFIKDTIKKGWEKLKSVFKLGMKKIKGFMAIFDSSGKVLPVISPCAVIDRFSGSKVVKVYAPKELSQLTIEAGGKGCPETAPVETSDEDFEFAEEGSLEYKNFLSIGKYLGGQVSESWEAIKKDRTPYSSGGEGIEDVDTIDYDEFRERITMLLKERIQLSSEEESKKMKYGTLLSPTDNILVFGAPGIGKSTIPDLIVTEYNENIQQNGGNPSQMISLIKVDCANLKPGDLLMPTPPKPIDILGEIKLNKETFPASAEYLANLSEEETEQLQKKIENSAQFLVTDAPKCFLPAFKPVGGDIDRIQNDRANSSVYKDKKTGKTIKVGNGGIIFFDELLRADPMVFHELMNLLFDRSLQGWQLGSKWCIVACSNRPVDSELVRKVWTSWESEPAEKSRFPLKFVLVPDPESWKEYQKKKWSREDLGNIDILFDFIFEKSSKEKGEYPRWISQVISSRGSEESKTAIPIEPRQWTKAIEQLKNYMLYHDIDNILKLTDIDLRKAFKGVLNKDLREEFITWLEDHRDTVDIGMIMDDPTYLKLDDEIINDTVKANNVISNIEAQLHDMYGKEPERLDDKKLSNIYTWIGINFPDNVDYEHTFVVWITTEFLNGKYGNKNYDYTQSELALYAAYPEKDVIETIKMRETRKYEKQNNLPQGSLEKVKDLMRKYFPWRLKGNEIVYYGEAELKPKKSAKKKD